MRDLNKGNADLKPYNTERDGNCAFHAALGEWDGNKFICPKVTNVRDRVAEKIKVASTDDRIFTLTKEGIKALIMENRVLENQLAKLKESYIRHGREIDEAWHKFEDELRKHTSIINYINKQMQPTAIIDNLPNNENIVNSEVRQKIENDIKLAYLVQNLDKVSDDNDSFFDALAKILNELHGTNKYDEKVLRETCHKYYKINKDLVDDWNQLDPKLSLGKDEYYFIQYTKDEIMKNFHNRKPIPGRAAIEGIILCNSFGLEGILIIQIPSVTDEQNQLLSYYLVDKSGYKEIPIHDIYQLLCNTFIPKLAVNQKDSHFTPIFPSSLDLKDIQAQSRKSITDIKSKESALKDNFRSNFNILIEKSNELKKLINHIPELKQAYQQYCQISKQDYWLFVDWNKNIINEYANYIGTSGNWLLPHELELIALTENITIDFRIAKIDLVNNEKRIETEAIYNPGKRLVVVYFDGENHYERMVNSLHLEFDLNTSPLTKPNDKIIEIEEFETTISESSFSDEEMIEPSEERPESKKPDITINLDSSSDMEMSGSDEETPELKMTATIIDLCSSADEEMSEFGKDKSEIKKPPANSVMRSIKPSVLNIAETEDFDNNKAIYEITKNIWPSVTGLKNISANISSTNILYNDRTEDTVEREKVNNEPADEQLQAIEELDEIESLPFIKLFIDNDDIKMQDKIQQNDVKQPIPGDLIRKKEQLFESNFILNKGAENGRYTGVFNTSLNREGLGSYNTDSGSYHYLGEWKNDKPNGIGYQYISQNAKVWYGKFDEGTLKKGWVKEEYLGKEKNVYRHYNYTYKGEMKKGQYHGLGQLKFAVGSKTYRVSGIWKNGKLKEIDNDQLSKSYQENYAIFQKALDDILIEPDLENLREKLLLLSNLYLQTETEIELLDSINAEEISLLDSVKSAATNLAAISSAYDELQRYANIPEPISYRKVVETIVKKGINIYKSMLTTSAEDNKFLTLAKIIDFKASEFTGGINLKQMQNLLKIDYRVINLIQAILARFNQVLTTIPDKNHTAILSEFTTRLKNFWDKYLVYIKQEQVATSYDKQIHELIFGCYSFYLDLIIEKNKENSNTISPLSRDCRDFFYNGMQNLINNITSWGEINKKAIEKFFHIKLTNEKALFFEVLIALYELSHDRIKEPPSNDGIINLTRNKKRRPNETDPNIRELIIETSNSILEHLNKSQQNKIVNYEREINKTYSVIKYIISLAENKYNLTDDHIKLQSSIIKNFLKKNISFTDALKYLNSINYYRKELKNLLTGLFSQAKIFQNEIDKLLAFLDSIFVNITDTAVSEDTILEGLNNLNELIINLRSSDFKWYIVESDLKFEKELPEGTIFHREGNIYEVKNVKAAKTHVNIQQHTGLTVLNDILEKIVSGDIIAYGDKTLLPQARIKFLKALSISLNNFNKQKEYIDLESFKRDFMNIYNHIINNSCSYDDLCEKLNQIDKLFLYNTTINQLSMDTAINKMQQIAGNKLKNNIISALKKTYENYEEIFIDYTQFIIKGTPEIYKSVDKTKFLDKYKVSTIEQALLKAVEQDNEDYEKHVNEIKDILKLKPYIDYQNENKQTALHIAIEKDKNKRDKKLIKLLLLNGADYQAINRESNINLRRLEMEALIEKHKDKGKENNINYSLRSAAYQGKVRDILCLIKLGADINAPDMNRNKTALHYAIEKGQVDAAKILLSKGAKTNIKDIEHKTAVDYANERGLQGLFSNAMNNKEFKQAELIVKYGYYLKPPHNHQQKMNAILIDASRNGKLKDIKAIQEFGVQIDQQSKNIALDLAIESNRQDIVSLLIKHGATTQQTKLNTEQLNKFDYELSSKHCIHEVVDKTKELAALWQLPYEGIKAKIQNKQLPYNILNSAKLAKKLQSNLEIKQAIIPHILAGLAAILAFGASNELINEDNGYRLKNNKVSLNILLKPHRIQILGILHILGVDNDAKEVENHLAEILTGQGKSWVLALLAGYFRLLDKNVDILCYSEYLTSRDEKDFQKILAPFFFNNIHYRTFDQISWEILGQGTNQSLSQLVKDIISGNKIAAEANNRQHNKDILLLDEVDVFFSEKFGSTYNTCVTIASVELAQFQKNLWKKLQEANDKNELEKYALSWLASISSKDPKLLGFLNQQISAKGSTVLKYHIDEMIKDAIEIKNGSNLDFAIIDNQVMKKIGNSYKRSILGYQNSFYYLKEKFRGPRSIDTIPVNHNYGYLMFNSGTVSYSEIPKKYTRILGVSGSLQDLKHSEKSMINDYKITRRSYFPTFFGGSNLDNFTKRQIIINTTEDAWFNSIKDAANIQLRAGRAVLIFFETIELLETFRQCHAAYLGDKPYCITPNKIIDEHNEIVKEKDEFNNKLEKLIDEAGSANRYTLLTREFGRGTDFKGTAEVNAKGGTHVIQTFLSIDKKEETQIKGRTARKDDRGSYELLLCLEHIHKHIPAATVNSTYAWLEQQRDECYENICKKRLTSVTESSNAYENTMTLFNAIKQTYIEERRGEFITRICNEL